MKEPSAETLELDPRLGHLLRCVECGGNVRSLQPNNLVCVECGASFSVERGTARMLPPKLGPVAAGDEDPETAIKRGTAASFAYEWNTFGGPRAEWGKNFVDYMQPHPPEFFKGISVLDVGAGSGRHSAQAAQLGARVVASDLGDSIDVARRNLPPDVITVQADAEALPFAPASFDFVMSIGVLHHLPDTAAALRALVPYVKPGGRLHVYLYWQPSRRSHRALLRVVSLARKLTTRLPHRLLHAACYPLSAMLFAGIVVPYRVLRRFPGLARVADALPLKAYADYPFGVLVNDQFDRFSAPIEQRFTREQAEHLMRNAGLVDVVVLPNNGWVCDGRRPPTPRVETPSQGSGNQIQLSAVAAQSPLTPGFRIRVLQMKDELAGYGVAVEPELLFTAAEERRFRQGSLSVRSGIVFAARRRLISGLHDRGGTDVTLIQRQVDMLPSLRLERAACEQGRVIWDVDDAIWLDTAKVARTHPLAMLKRTRHKVKWLAERADHVIAGNRILAEWLADYADPITVIPSVVETRAIEPKQHHDGKTVTLGWIGSPSTAPYLAPIRGIVSRLQRAVPGRSFRMLLVGGALEPIEGVEIEMLPWSPETERLALETMDVGLMPLPNTPWTRGKCSYKALQYMAAGVPVLADDVGMAMEVIGDGGRAIQAGDDWVESLAELAKDVSLRRRIGLAGRERVEQDYSVQRWVPVVAEVVRGERPAIL